MAILVVCSIRDTVVGAFNRPFCLQSRGQAIRSFTDEVLRPSDENPMYKHPGDYDLYELGTFDDASGQFELSPQPVHVLNGASVK